MAHMVHVLLVEYDTKDHDEIKNMLQYLSYKVSTTKLASTALSMLSKQKDEYDIVIVNMNSPDSYGLQLLQYAAKMDLLVVLMLDDDDAITIMRALEQGAFLCAKKPLTMDMIGYLWQHVLREKAYRPRENERDRGAVQYNAPHRESGEDLIEGNLKGNKNSAEKHKSKKNASLGSSQQENVMFRKKVWTEWTQELHEKFMDAVTQLGEGRCYPKDILELMNVPGLTRMQVASHLQKCRNAKWQPPSERKSKLSDMMPSKSKAPRTKLLRFGSMPQLDSSGCPLKIQEHHENHRESITNQAMQTNVIENNHDGSSQKRYPPQLPDHGNYAFAQGNETFDGQHGGTFGMDNTFMFVAQSATPSINTSSNQRDITEDVLGFQNMDTMIQNFTALRQELGFDYNENVQSHVYDLYHNQAAGTSQWSRDIPK